MKNRLNYSLFYLLALVWLFGACSNDDDARLEQYNLTVSVTYPEDFQQEAAAGVTIELTNNASQETYTESTGELGEANFDNLVPGSYTVQATQQLAGEAALAATGSEVEINLSYLDNSFVLDQASAIDPLEIQLSGSISGGLVIKQVYYSGSKTPEDSNYFFDQFFEIYNNSSEPIALDGLIMSNIYGTSGLINDFSTPTPFMDDEYVYGSTAWRIPGSGEDHILEPFTSIIIAQQGINHQSEEANPASPVDLSGADFELFVDGSTRDIDAPNVENMEMLYHPFNATFSLVSVFGPTIVLWRTDDFNSLQTVAIPDAGPDFPQVLEIPAASVIEGMEALRSAEDAAFKRLPASLDAGFTFVTDTYTGQSVIRKSTVIDGNTVYQDTNNSSEDFIVSETPVLQ